MGKFYAYSVDKKEGITNNWKDCEKIVSGKQSARYKSFKTLKEAEEWLKAGAKYGVKKKMPEGIYFDAGTGRGQGVEISVTDEKGKDLLKEIISSTTINEHGKHLLPPGTTNNYGELLACFYAIQLAEKKNIKNVLGDSKLVVNYWSKGIAKIKELPSETSSLIIKIKKLRTEFEKNGGRIELISGDDNPADLGFHK